MAEKDYKTWLTTAAIFISLIFFAGCVNQPAARELTPDEAKNKTLDYINNYLVEKGTKASAVSIEDEGSVYNLITSYQGQQIPVYISKDGVYLFLQVYPLPGEIKSDLRQFIGCLNSSGFRIYGTTWCTYCKQLVEMLGGYDMVKPIFINCEEQQEECARANISSYPTIFIKDTPYEGQRTYKSFSKATGCPVVLRELTADEAKSKSIDYINNYLVQQGTKASAVSVETVGSNYRTNISYMGRQIPVYMTKDGAYLFLQAINMNEQVPTPTPTPTPSNIKAEDLKQFVSCLNNSSFKIYGTKSCTYCKQLVEMLGGYDMVKPIYIDCNEQPEECSKANIRAYPTIFINGTYYKGQRTFADFSNATGCPVPPGA